MRESTNHLSRTPPTLVPAVAHKDGDPIAHNQFSHASQSLRLLSPHVQGGPGLRALLRPTLGPSSSPAGNLLKLSCRNHHRPLDDPLTSHRRPTDVLRLRQINSAFSCRRPRPPGTHLLPEAHLYPAFPAPTSPFLIVNIYYKGTTVFYYSTFL